MASNRRRQCYKPVVEVSTTIIVAANLVFILLAAVYKDVWEEASENKLGSDNCEFAVHC